MVIVAVSPSTLMPWTSPPLPDLEQAARVRAAAVARPPAMTVRREMEEDMVVPFAGPGGPSDGREERLDSAGADDVADGSRRLSALTRLVIASAVVHQPAEHVADELDNADDEDDDDHGDDHDVHLVALVPVLDGEVTHAATADGAGHGGVAQEGDDGDGGRLDEDRQGSRTRTPQVICRPEAPIMRAASTLP